jgi:peptidoglycan/xylan/chitin deacetylase (PgdA/CDA1 family)
MGPKDVVRIGETLLARGLLRSGAEPRGVLALLFHGIEEEGETLETVPFAPYQRITLSSLEFIVRSLREAGYRFVSPCELETGSAPGRCAWLTFDDGYANNLPLAPFAQRLDVPLTVFASTGHVESGEAFWWDALWRACRERGLPAAEYERRVAHLKGLPPAAIRAEMEASFGPGSLRPAGDRDRPMTVEELAGFARAPHVTIGNHTRHHAILPVLPLRDRGPEIARAQDDLRAWLGTAPATLAYPNGDSDAETEAAAAACGIRLATTTAFGRARLPLARPLAVPRIALAENHPRPLHDQLVRARAGISAAAALARLRR